MIVPARRRLPRSFNYRVRGFGDLSDQPLENCDPKDGTCVSRNYARSIAKNQAAEIGRADAARDACERDAVLNPNLPNNCGAWWPEGYGGTIPAPNTQAINPDAYASSFLTPDQAVAQVGSPNAAGGFTFHPPTPVAPPVLPAAKGGAVPPVLKPLGSSPTTPGGQTIINSSGAQNAPGSTAVASAFNLAGSSFSSVPWWGWAAAGVGALFMFGGGRGR